MREIKFRAWRKTSKTMHFINTIGTIPILSKETPKKYVVMQFTGLKDKNNKEIYEGDIVDIGITYCGDVEISAQKGIVTFEECEFFVKGQKEEYFNLQSIIINKDGKVIGNIYENPELLKESKS